MGEQPLDFCSVNFGRNSYLLLLFLQLFIVDGIITLPIAIIGFTFFPGLPTSRKPWFLTQAEHDRAKSRMDPGHRQAGKITLGVVTRTLKRPMWWLCVSIYVCLIQASYWTGYMSLWLKAAKVYSGETGRMVAKYSVEQINVYPTFVNLSTPLSLGLDRSLIRHAYRTLALQSPRSPPGSALPSPAAGSSSPGRCLALPSSPCSSPRSS